MVQNYAQFWVCPIIVARLWKPMLVWPFITPMTVGVALWQWSPKEWGSNAKSRDSSCANRELTKERMIHGANARIGTCIMVIISSGRRLYKIPGGFEREGGPLPSSRLRLMYFEIVLEILGLWWHQLSSLCSIPMVTALTAGCLKFSKVETSRPLRWNATFPVFWKLSQLHWPKAASWYRQ